MSSFYLMIFMTIWITNWYRCTRDNFTISYCKDSWEERLEYNIVTNSWGVWCSCRQIQIRCSSCPSVMTTRSKWVQARILLWENLPGNQVNYVLLAMILPINWPMHMSQETLKVRRCLQTDTDLMNCKKMLHKTT